MTYLVSSKKFTQEEMQDGTAQTWLQALSATIVFDVETQQLGNATTLLTVTYSTTGNDAITSVLEQSPDWAHISNEQPFNAQAADGSSTGYDVSSYKSLGFRLTDAICDGVLTITDSDGAPLMFTVDGILKSSHTCPASGTNKHTCKIVNGNPDQTIYVLTGRTTGSITIDTLYQ
jgi:hypothetical protein